MNQRLTLGVAICAYKGHIPHLRALLESIRNQTRLPDQVVISCSSSSPEEIPYRPEEYPFPLRILVHAEKRNAAQNRNCAASYLTTDIVSFFDADDTMHPQRMEIIEDCFRTNEVVLFLHSLQKGESCQRPFALYPLPPFYLLRSLGRCPWNSIYITVPHRNEWLACGHVTVRRAVLSEFCFPEGADAHGQEDMKFCTAVCDRYPSYTAYCPFPLSKYIQGFTRGHLDIKDACEKVE